MKDYKINFSANTVTVTKVFAEKANRMDTNEYKILTQLKKDFPNIAIIYNIRSGSKNASKGLTYKNMEKYINAFDNRDELLKAFRLVKQLSSVQKNKYQFVKSWFVAQFPDYDKLPTFSLMDNVIHLNIGLMEKVMDEEKQSA